MLSPKPLAVILAAGASSRFGSNKLLHTMADGQALICHSLAAYIESDCQVACVLRPDNSSDYKKLSDLLISLSVTVIECRNADQGMSASIAAAAAYAEQKNQPLLLGLGDMPFLKSKTIKQLLQAKNLLKPEILYPSYQGKQGHPVFFSNQKLPALGQLTGDKGAKLLLQSKIAQALVVDDPGVFRDVDKLTDLEA